MPNYGAKQRPEDAWPAARLSEAEAHPTPGSRLSIPKHDRKETGAQTRRDSCMVWVWAYNLYYTAYTVSPMCCKFWPSRCDVEFHTFDSLYIRVYLCTNISPMDVIISLLAPQWPCVLSVHHSAGKLCACPHSPCARMFVILSHTPLALLWMQCQFCIYS